MDLAFAPEEQAFALEVRTWLSENVDVPPRFENIAEEVEFGRAWQEIGNRARARRRASGYGPGLHCGGCAHATASAAATSAATRSPERTAPSM